jgi:hypothetical protein
MPGDPADPQGNRAEITGAVRALLDADATPVVLGGDDSHTFSISWTQTPTAW